MFRGNKRKEKCCNYNLEKKYLKGEDEKNGEYLFFYL